MDKTVLTFKDYNIGGNVLRAYYDADDKLVFVLDNTVDDRKPNALLVINPVGDRKWDDILANDYGVDLETVRPKKNNKYQKLDIEYSGLAEYDDLIRAYEDGVDLSDALAALADFREDSVRRAAAERLALAEQSAMRARETIQKSRDAIDELQTKLRGLRAKLAQQRRQIGREPTKKSASKILRTDAAVDATNEKLRRAKKRLANAQRRLIVADTDAESAREILARDNNVVDVKKTDTDDVVLASEKPRSPIQTTYNVSFDEDVDDALLDDDDEVHYSTESDIPTRVNMAARNDDNVVRMRPDDDDEETVEFTENQNIDEPKAENMADETQNDEVKPLFDEDPQILDEGIAFKPIEFGVSSPAPNQASDDEPIYDDVMDDDKPLSFTPPVDNDDDVAQPTSPSVLDSMRPVDVPKMSGGASDELDSELMGGDSLKNSVPEPESVRPVETPRPAVNSAQPATPVSNIPNVPQDGEQVMRGQSNNAPYSQPQPAPQPYVGATPAPADNMVRPQSPLGADGARPVPPTVTGVPNDSQPRKPTFMYYVLLILLIGLSVFTLWFYQKNTSDKTPDLSAEVADVVATETAAEEAPKVEVDTSDEIVEPVVLPEPEPEPVVVPEPEPEPEPAPEPVADIVVETINAPVLEPEPEPEIESEEDILARKPAYNVSQNENMFVAAPDYDTETLRQQLLESEAVDTTGPDVVADADKQPDVLAVDDVAVETTVAENESVAAPAPMELDEEQLVNDEAEQYYVAESGTLSDAVYNTAQSDYAVDNTYQPDEADEDVLQSVTSVVWPADDADADLPMCPDGTAPDIYGCCAGEIYTDMGDAGFNCCPEAGGDCFPPLI